ncbi:MAG: aminopeptidase [Candidatus Aenigmarchaeota archaeon]|nr:aminopeptidase [Candidatus Aenigmarchaeota archaeon]
MTDPRIKKLAKIVVEYSLFVKKGERVIISADIPSQDLVKEVYKLVLKKGAYPSIHLGIPGLTYFYYKNASKEQLTHFPKIYWYEVKNTQKFLGIGSPLNTRELSNIDPKKIAIRNKVTNKITDYIVNAKPKIYRCTMDFPTNALAQDAEMSLEEYENFFFNACLLDWKKLSKKWKRIRDYLNKSTEFRIVSKDTDLTMKIYPKSFVLDDGHENMPGGEVFGAPQKYSVNGYIRFTYPAIRSGVEVTNIYCEFKNGKCIKATADKNENFLNKMLDTDKGSRYIGEIGLGMNPKINKFTKNLLFDEKIGGTIHLAFGMAYKECGQPNKSALHWDIVKDLRKDGKIIVDGKVVMKNGKWLI